jgi:hypothetical protein
MREIVNPSTGATESVPCWDPEFGKPTPEYAIRDLPGPAIEMQGFEKLGIDSLIPLIEGSNCDAVIAARQRPPLIHPEEGPWLLEVPPTVVEKLAALPDAEIPSLGHRWAAALRAEDALYVAALRKLVGFSRETMTAGHRMYEWYSAPGQEALR